MKVERPRAARYPFSAPLDLTNLHTNRRNSAFTRDLSVFGCHTAPGISPPAGTRVRIRIAYKGKVFEALGRVTNVREDGSAGIAFTQVEQGHQFVLDQWIAEIRNAKTESLLQGD